MSGFVYFIGPEALLYRKETVVKIGFTKNHPASRLRALQIGSPETLDLFAYISGGADLEKAFHDCFAELRSHGEWFYLERKLFDFLAYFDRPPGDHFITREEVEVSIFDNIFAECSSHPSMTDADYLASAEPQHLRRFFPELWMERFVERVQ